MTSKKFNLLILKLKRGAVFGLGLTLFFFPGQNYYSTAMAVYIPTSIRQLDFFLPQPALYPENFTGPPAPNITARSVIVIDQASSVMLLGKNEKMALLPASTVKIMTALIALDAYQLTDVLTVKQINDLGQNIKLIEGERLTVQNLLYGLLVSSANDAALVLAQNYPGGTEAFVKQMNQKATQLNLLSTYFANPTGLDSDEEGKPLRDYSYTTALDLARLVAYALNNPDFAQIVATEKITITDVEGKIKHPLYNLNQLLGKVTGLKGVKTGWTQEAGECFVAYTQRNGQGIISVILDSEDRFGETTKLIDWVFTNYHW